MGSVTLLQHYSHIRHENSIGHGTINRRLSGLFLIWISVVKPCTWLPSRPQFRWNPTNFFGAFIVLNDRDVWICTRNKHCTISIQAIKNFHKTVISSDRGTLKGWEWNKFTRGIQLPRENMYYGRYENFLLLREWSPILVRMISEMLGWLRRDEKILEKGEMMAIYTNKSALLNRIIKWIESFSGCNMEIHIAWLLFSIVFFFNSPVAIKGILILKNQNGMKGHR